ncbi:MAG: chorismate lyase [Gallionella sp.]|nr:chorismate lyase [Gallionella sp.]MDD4958885.1 chorismate lyase [Gallionella sp.]
MRLISTTPDRFWHRTTLGCPAELHPWLHDHGSLTQRIQQRCSQFAVHPIRSGLTRIAYDEAALLGIPPSQHAYSREVFLYADGQPVVFAHSALAPADLRDTWAAVSQLGNKPLGTLLFSHPLIRRMPLSFKALRPHHPLYRRAIAQLSHPPSRLWARRSLFYLHHAPLLVTEVFLPEIFELGDIPVHIAVS